MDAIPWILLAACAALLLLAVIGWWWERTRLSRGSTARQRVARRGESEAESLLGDEGFDVLDRQITAVWQVWVDDEEVEVRSRADLLVERDGLRFVAEVKTGGVAPDPCHPATRRQLLEYLLAFPVDGVLLVDMAERRVREVRFPDRAAAPDQRSRMRASTRPSDSIS